MKKYWEGQREGERKGKGRESFKFCAQDSKYRKSVQVKGKGKGTVR